MNDPTAADAQPELTAAEVALHRRRFLRGGALLAAAAGGAVAATVSPATTDPAVAADGDVLHVGASSEASSTTSLTLIDNPAAPALTLTNANGPALLLDPSVRGFTGKLPVGGLAATPSGVLIGLEDDNGKPYTSYLVAAPDLARIPITAPFGPARILNTKDKHTYDSIVDTSSEAFDSHHRLKKGAWIDVTVLPTFENTELLGAFITLTTLDSTKGGSMTACSPAYKPEKVVSLPFGKGKTVAVGTAVEAARVGSDYCIRIYTTATTHLKIDLTAFTLTSSFGGMPGAATSPDVAVRHAINSHLKAVNARAVRS